jgi:ABC-type Fe3+-siderophore transport system permease subunit
METDILIEYRQYAGRKRWVIVALMVAMGLLGTFSITLGPLNMSIAEVYATLSNRLLPDCFSIFLILGMSRFKGASPGNMVLAGVALSYLFGAGTTVLQYFAESWAVAEVVFWMVGSLAKSTWNSLRFVFASMLICVPYLLLKTEDLNVMNAGDRIDNQRLGLSL